MCGLRSLRSLVALLVITSTLGKNLKPVKVPALGRPFALGDLYDLKEDAIIKGPKLWTQEELDNFKEMKTHKTEFEIISSEKIDVKNSHFDIKARISLSFLAGLITVSGSAAYLDDRVQTSNVARVSLQYQTRTFFRDLKPSMYTRVDFPDVLKKTPGATHVVTAIQYGAGAVFVFDRTVAANEVKKDVKGSLSIAVKALPGIKISGSGSVEMTEEQKKNSKNFQCKFYGDFVLQDHPASYEDAVRVYKELPKLLGNNKTFENSVPMTVWLFPLEALPISKASQILHEVSNSMLSQVTFEIEDLNELITLSNDILDSEVAIFHDRINQNVAAFKSNIKQYSLLFKQELVMLLPKIRGNGTSEASLAKLLSSKESSTFSKFSLRSWLNDLLEETTVLKTTQRLPNYCKNDGNFAAMLQNNVKYTFGLTMRLDSIEDAFLDAMEKCLKKKRIEATVRFFAYPGRKDKWWRPGGKMASDLHKKSMSFYNFFLKEQEKLDMNLKSDIQFLVRETELDPTKDKADRGITIELYEDATLIDSNYEIPSNPGVPEEVRSTHDSIQIRWDEPTEGMKNINYYEVTTFMLNENPGNSTDHDDLYIEVQKLQTFNKTESIKVERLEAKRTYLFLVSVYSAFGKTAESIQSKFIQTKACPKGMFHISEHKCNFCEPGLYSDTLGAKSCTRCPQGTYREGYGGSSLADCTSCPKGTYNENIGSSSINQCLKCSTGTFNDKIRSPSQADCSRCPPGSFSNLTGQTSKQTCIPCKAGSYNPNEGAFRCTICPTGSTTTKQGAVDDDQCGKGSIDSKMETIVIDMSKKITDIGSNMNAQIAVQGSNVNSRINALQNNMNSEIRRLEVNDALMIRCESGLVNSGRWTSGRFNQVDYIKFTRKFSKTPQIIVSPRYANGNNYEAIGLSVYYSSANEAGFTLVRRSYTPNVRKHISAYWMACGP